MSHDNNTSAPKKKPEQEHLDATAGYSHHHTKATEGGKCLWRGLYQYKLHSCSYRYQARQRAEEDNKVYNWPAYKSTTEKGERVKTAYDKNSDYPRWYREELDAPKASEWDVQGKNFKGGLKPYWNNAHHIIPVGSLKESLQGAAKELAETRAAEGKTRMISESDLLFCIEESLLATEYNINHKTNMIILPMDHSVSDVLRLPKHGGPTSNNHTNYNRLVKNELDKIVNLYRSHFCDLPDKEHLSEQHRKAQKRRLELLSARVYKLITQDCLRGQEAQPPPAYQGGKSLESEAPNWERQLQATLKPGGGA